MAIDLNALWQISYGMYLIGAGSDGRINAQVANAMIQSSLTPVRLAVSINKQNLTHELIEQGGWFSVSVLEEETPLKFIGTFGFKSGRENDKFAGVEYRLGESGCPLITEHGLSIYEAKVVDKADAVTHTIFVGEVSLAEIVKAGRPLTYDYYQNVKKGKASQNAPTYKG